MEIVSMKSGFLGYISEREDLNKRIGCNEKFDFSKDYIIEYKKILDVFLGNFVRIDKLNKSGMPDLLEIRAKI